MYSVYCFIQIKNLKSNYLFWRELYNIKAYIKTNLLVVHLYAHVCWELTKRKKKSENIINEFSSNKFNPFFHKHRISIFRYINVAFDFQIMDFVFKLNLVYITITCILYCIYFYNSNVKLNKRYGIEVEEMMLHKTNTKGVYE